MAVTGPKTGFRIVNADGGSSTQDLGDRYVSKDFLIDVYPSISGNFGVTAPGLWTWGINTNGELGLNNVNPRSSPVQVGSLSDWNRISGGFAHTLAIKTGGNLWAWGLNTHGQLGDGTRTARSSPVQIGALTDWKQVGAGGYALAGFSGAIKTNGTLWTWGNNGAGQLGSGNRTHRSSPAQVGALTNWKLLSVGSYHMLATKTDGTLWGWGSGTNGRLGDNSTVSKSSPVQVGALTNWKQVSTGGNHTSAVKTDGTLWAWGDNSLGKLGDNTLVAKSSPVQIGLLTDWKQVSAGGISTAAIKTNGTLWTWGSNVNGQLGLGDTTNRSSPVQVGTLTNWKEVSASAGAAGVGGLISIKTDGTLWAWGNNAIGQLGLGNIIHRSSPVQVGSLTSWKIISAGAQHSVSILDAIY